MSRPLYQYEVDELMGQLDRCIILALRRLRSSASQSSRERLAYEVYEVMAALLPCRPTYEDWAPRFSAAFSSTLSRLSRSGGVRWSGREWVEYGPCAPHGCANATCIHWAGMPGFPGGPDHG